ncbi:MAG: hypothetical protein DMF63_15535 [Acidobacteria bacterium]|nr:MAG: hypothetical protein DMF63_15535 [Acidobacteriota bacterium]
MELDFDKEMDAMLRKAQRDAPVLVGDFASSRHLDADEISAFAENAVPEKSRALQMAHLADCDRCRKVLSNVLVMNAETAPVQTSPSVITIAERAPWYKRLFLFPNLAYVMGSLVLIFSAFLGYTIIKKSSDGTATISQATAPAETKGGPSFQNEPAFPSDQTASNSAANIAPNAPSANMNASAFGRTGNERGPAEDTKAAENNFSMDGAASGGQLAAAAPPPPPVAANQPALAEPKDQRQRDDDRVAKEKTESKVLVDTMSENAKNDSSLDKQKQYPGAGSVAQSGPMRANENQYNRQLEKMDARRSAAAKKATPRAEEESSSGKRSVSGKTFERKQGVWYDVSFHGQPTINIRRGSAEFSKLDAGLKSIANSLSGTAVIVWGAKAYRIQ